MAHVDRKPEGRKRHGKTKGGEENEKKVKSKKKEKKKVTKVTKVTKKENNKINYQSVVGDGRSRG
ncbi:hypothetical protein K0M31_011332 [Melipona bicolor]|uniref:Uncharacterized protein n=1 Tax=Melipona bicolor TaxID=60889 RepID=A0AA40G9C3_9HYME|nr:hypothetical protein K0M31_011332 [Melipona bicolor]